MGDGGPPVEMEFGGKARPCALGLLGFGYQNICMAGKPKASREAGALGMGTGWDPREAASVEATSSLGGEPEEEHGEVTVQSEDSLQAHGGGAGVQGGIREGHSERRAEPVVP